MHRFNFSCEEAKRCSQLLDEDSDLLQNASVILDLLLERLNLGVPLEHFILNVVNLETKFGGCWVTLANVEPKLLILRHNPRLDVIEAHLRLQNSLTTVDIKDLDNKRALIIINLELNLGVAVCWCAAFRRFCLSVLIALIANNMRAVDILKIFGANDRDVQDAHGTLDEVAMGSLGRC